MTRYRVRPTRTVAVGGAIFGVVVVAVGVAMRAVRGDEVPIPVLAVWLAFGAAVTVFSLWAAFAENGRTQTLHVADDVPDDSTSTDVETI